MTRPPDEQVSAILRLLVGVRSHLGLLDEARADGDAERAQAITVLVTPGSSLAEMETAAGKLGDEKWRRRAMVLVERRRYQRDREREAERDQARRRAQAIARDEEVCCMRGADTPEKRAFVVERFGTEVSGVQRIWKDHGRIAWDYLAPYLARGERAAEICASVLGLDDKRQVSVAWALANTRLPAARRLVEPALGIGGFAPSLAVPVDDRAWEAAIGELEKELRQPRAGARTDAQGAAAR